MLYSLICTQWFVSLGCWVMFLLMLSHPGPGPDAEINILLMSIVGADYHTFYVPVSDFVHLGSFIPSLIFYDKYFILTLTFFVFCVFHSLLWVDCSHGCNIGSHFRGVLSCLT